MNLEVIQIKFGVITNESVFESNIIKMNYYQIHSQVKPNGERIQKNLVKSNLLSVWM